MSQSTKTNKEKKNKQDRRKQAREGVKRKKQQEKEEQETGLAIAAMFDSAQKQADKFDKKQRRNALKQQSTEVQREKELAQQQDKKKKQQEKKERAGVITFVCNLLNKIANQAVHYGQNKEHQQAATKVQSWFRKVKQVRQCKQIEDGEITARALFVQNEQDQRPTWRSYLTKTKFVGWVDRMKSLMHQKNMQQAQRDHSALWKRRACQQRDRSNSEVMQSKALQDKLDNERAIRVRLHDQCTQQLLELHGQKQRIEELEGAQQLSLTHDPNVLGDSSHCQGCMDGTYAYVQQPQVFSESVCPDPPGQCQCAQRQTAISW